MKVPYSWLKEYVDLDITAQELTDKLFDCGFEVEELLDLGAEISRVVVGEVLSCEKVEGTHLFTCQVNCGEDGKLSPVDKYATTKGACGGVDFWGNCWEWTATSRGEGNVAVKGGAFDSKRTECRTEAKNTARNASKGYLNVTIRLVRETR